MLLIQHAFSTQSVALADIDGYRVEEKNEIFLVTKNGEKSLTLPDGIARRKELVAWIKEKYEDLDAREKAAETIVLLEDSHYGGSRGDREQNLQKAGKISKIGTGVGFVLFLWCYLYPQPYGLVMLLSFVSPLIAGYITWSFKGLMRLYSKKSSPYPTLFILMTFPILGTALNAFMRYNLYGFPLAAWLTLAGMSALLSVVALAVLKETVAVSAKKAAAVAYVVSMATVYSYGLLIYSNCYYDRSATKAWHVAVTGKRESDDNTTTYHLQLSPWGKYADGKEVTVSSGFYQSVNQQDSVGVLLNKGKWGIPWYRIVRHGD